MKKHTKNSSLKPSNTVLSHPTPRLRDHFIMGKKLGHGQFGTTYLCRQKSTGVDFACKSIPKRKLLCKEDYDDVWREIQIMHHLSEFPCVVRIKGAYEDNVFVHLVMELCAGGELFDRIIQKGHYSEKEAAKLMKTIVGVFSSTSHTPFVLPNIYSITAHELLDQIVIAERLSEEEIGGLKQLFKMLDTDNSGTITFEELKQGLKKVGSNLTESEIKELMDAADIDSNGTIEYGEFLAATLHMNKLEREENLLAAFRFFDKDGSGYITRDELQQASKDFGLQDAQLDEMIREVDQDNDGRIDYAEFTAMMRKGDDEVRSRAMKGNLNFDLAEALSFNKNKESQD
ncbi:LOW QUALITY PROTEIN: hypothetical protein M8C21_007289 [Ambrosia artemisiifolia]|uniref:non-specific serine/threonine protein kinase n=1 Tax=Ambrosia artemisiifolia TaxID=4212 RepID=A0AAD5CPS4_AMBAR|nr:LOW QUALITY PROTEIN: hypothetical protein M8C21_007289 [Ambrosia artemisiifolia]